MISWIGKTQDNIFRYTAQAETFKALYERIEKKYGYGHVLDENSYEIKLLKVNGQNLKEFENVEENAFDYSVFEDWYMFEKEIDLCDEHYKELIEESISQVYHHEFVID